MNEGENVITITATDLAGNKTTVTRTVFVETEVPELRDITPAEDVNITAGESVTVSFKSKPGLQASFRIQLPLNLNAEAAGKSRSWKRSQDCTLAHIQHLHLLCLKAESL